MRLPVALSGLTRHALTRNTLANLAIKFVGIPLALGANILLARMLGPSEYGRYGIALSVFLVSVMPVTTAIANLTVREISLAVAERAQARALGAVAFACMMLVLFSGLYAGAAWLVQLLKPDGLAGAAHLLNALPLTAWMFPLFLLTTASGAVLRASGHNFLGVLPEQALRQFVWFLVLAVVFASGESDLYTVEWAFDLHTVALGISAAVALALLFSRGTLWRPFNAPEIRWRAWSATIFPFLTLGFVQISITHLPTIALGYHGLLEAAGHYRVAEQLAGLASLPLLAANLSFGPMIARFRASGDRAGLQARLASATWLARGLSVPALVILVLAPEWIMELCFGPDYIVASELLIVLAVGTAFNAIIGPVGLMLNMLGHERVVLAFMSMICLTSLILAFVLVPLFGAMGAAVSALTVKVLSNLTLLGVLHRLEGYSTVPSVLKPRSIGS